MHIKSVCQNYFKGFYEIRSKVMPPIERLVVILKIFSYFTALIPLGFAITYAFAKNGRVKELKPKNEKDAARIIKVLSKDKQDSFSEENLTLGTPKSVGMNPKWETVKKVLSYEGSSLSF